MIWWQRLPLPRHKNRQRLNCFIGEHFIPHDQTTIPLTRWATLNFDTGNNARLHSNRCYYDLKWSVFGIHHYGDVIMVAIASQVTSLAIVYSTVYSDADQRKYQSSASLAFVRGIPVNSPHKGPVTRKIFPFDDVIMFIGNYEISNI